MDWLQAGYYPLKTPEGSENGYICLNFLPAGLEILVTLDQAPVSEIGFEGCFTDHLAVKKQGMSAHFPAAPSTGKYRARCVVSLSDQVFPEGSVDYTLFNKEKPMVSAILYTAPEPVSQPELSESEEESKPLQEPEVEAEEEVLQEEIPLSLTPFDPFNTTNEAYEWWFCKNNDDFHQLMAHTGLIPHPPLYTALQSALVRYGHFLFGRYTEENEDRILFILGVPGLESTLQEAGSARWIPAQNKITGAMDYTGYSLYYFDAETGKAVRAIIRQ